MALPNVIESLAALTYEQRMELRERYPEQYLKLASLDREASAGPVRYDAATGTWVPNPAAARATPPEGAGPGFLNRAVNPGPSEDPVPGLHPNLDPQSPFNQFLSRVAEVVMAVHPMRQAIVPAMRAQRRTGNLQAAMTRGTGLTGREAGEAASLAGRLGVAGFNPNDVDDDDSEFSDPNAAGPGGLSGGRAPGRSTRGGVGGGRSGGGGGGGGGGGTGSGTGQGGGPSGNY